MDFLELVKEARSCRRFAESRPLALADLEWLVDCARFAPSARNAQELRFVLVSDPQYCQKVFALTRWAGALKDWPGPQPGERPTGFIIIVKPAGAGEFVDYSVGIAGYAIQLGAASRGWGGCMLGAFDHAKMTELLGVENAGKPALVIGLGVAAEKRILEPLAPGQSFAYWRDAAGAHHVPKRSAAELIIKRFGGV